MANKTDEIKLTDEKKIFLYSANWHDILLVPAAWVLQGLHSTPGVQHGWSSSPSQGKYTLSCFIAIQRHQLSWLNVVELWMETGAPGESPQSMERTCKLPTKSRSGISAPQPCRCEATLVRDGNHAAGLTVHRLHKSFQKHPSSKALTLFLSRFFTPHNLQAEISHSEYFSSLFWEIHQHFPRYF